MFYPRCVGASASIIVLLVFGIVGVNCIFGGSDAKPGEFPWQVSVQAYAQHLCGGIMITKRHILTAAHCFDGITEPPFSEITVVTGSNTLEPGTGNTHRVKNIVVHKQHSSQTIGPVENDIAVISLRKEIVENAHQSAIGLPSGEVPSGVFGIVSGFGQINRDGKPSKILQKLMVKIEGSDGCINLGVRVKRNQMCVYQENGSGTTKGDSGGPLVYNGAVVGVSSKVPIRWGIGIPSIYTRVYYNKDFIQQAIANN